MCKRGGGGLAVAFATWAAMMVCATARADDPPGVLWAMTSQMSMPGMPMSPPPHTANVCTPTVWNKPPPGGDASCVSTNFQHVNDTASWDTQCHGMTGHGTITFAGTDSYSGSIDETADGMTVTIKLSGKKLGTCDTPVE